MEIADLITNELIQVEALVINQAEHLNLTLDQLGFLLLFYRYTKKNAWLLPSAQQFAKVYNIDLLEVKKLQNFLFQNGYCEIDTKTNDATLVEYVDWNLLYKRLGGTEIQPLSISQSSVKVELAKLLEREFGRMLSPMEIELAGIWSQSYEYDDIVDAIKEAVLSDVKNLKYIDKILLNWSQGGRRKDFKGTSKVESASEVQLDTYYNWLEEENK